MKDSEPLSNITVSGENVVYKQEGQDDRRDMVYDCELLADEQCYTILGTGKLFD